MSEPSPEHDLNSRAQHSVMGNALDYCMKQESMRVVFEQIPKAVVGGTIAFPHKDAPDSNFLVIVSRYDADVALPSTDGVFYDIHIMSNDDEAAGDVSYAARYIISDIAANNAEPFWPLTEAVIRDSLDDEVYKNVSSWLAYTQFSDASTEEALQCLEWWRIIEPIGSIDQEQPDMPFYDFTRALKTEWQG